jgi:hypothetical protein
MHSTDFEARLAGSVHTHTDAQIHPEERGPTQRRSSGCSHSRPAQIPSWQLPPPTSANTLQEGR